MITEVKGGTRRGFSAPGAGIIHGKIPQNSRKTRTHVWEDASNSSWFIYSTSTWRPLLGGLRNWITQLKKCALFHGKTAFTFIYLFVYLFPVICLSVAVPIVLHYLLNNNKLARRNRSTSTRKPKSVHMARNNSAHFARTTPLREQICIITHSSLIFLHFPSSDHF